MKNLLLVGILILAVASVSIRAECINGEVKKSSDSDESDVSLFFKNVGCTLQQGAIKVQEGAKKLGGEIKEGAKKFKESAKKFGSDVKTKFSEIKEKITASSEEKITSEEKTTASSAMWMKVLSKEDDTAYDILNDKFDGSDQLKDEWKCGKGFILDVLGDCKKD